MAIIKNPCKGICKINTEFNLCIGCYRTPNEKLKWTAFTDPEKERTLMMMKVRETKFGKITPDAPKVIEQDRDLLDYNYMGYY